MSVLSRLGAYMRLARIEKPVGWLLLLWPTLWAVWLASDGIPTWSIVALFTGGVFLTRCFGCCINDIADCKLDTQVERTRYRPLAAGDIQVSEAVALATVFLYGCFLLWLQLNLPARWWSIGALVLAFSYPLAKRISQLPQLHLSVTFGMGIPVAYAHITGSVPASAWLLVAANFCWVFAFDTIYAMVDRQDDLKAGNRSSAIWLGERDLQGVALAYFACLTFLIVHGVIINADLAFFFACALAFGMAYRFCLMLRGRHRDRCFACFRQNHWFGALIWLGIVAGTGIT